MTYKMWTIHIARFFVTVSVVAVLGCAGIKSSLSIESESETASVKINVRDSVRVVVQTWDMGLDLIATLYDDGELVIPNGVTEIGLFKFAKNTQLRSVTIPSSVMSIGGFAFDSCVNLASVAIPNSVTGIHTMAFRDCKSLVSITLPDSLTYFDPSAFRDCSALTSIYVSKNNINFSDVDGVLFNKDMTVLVRYPPGRHGAYIIPDGVTSIARDAFSDCTGLTSISIPNSVTVIRDAFMYCSSLTSVTIPSNVTEIGNQAFFSCVNLTSIYVVKDNAHYSDLNGILLNKDKTELIQYPGGRHGAYIIPEGITKIAPWAFARNIALTSVTIPSSVVTIGEWAFIGSVGIKSITIPANVTVIGKSAFEYCSNISTVTFMGNETRIRENAFKDCDSLTTIKVLSPIPLEMSSAVFSDKIKDISCLYVPDGSINIYRNASRWNEFECIKDIALAPLDEGQ